MTLDLHTPPAAGFDEPFEMLHACHGRLQRMLALLGRLGEHLAAQGCDAQARSAAADVQRYFDLAGPLHHEDEELHVLPALRAAGEAALADALHAEHEAMEQQWLSIRAELQAVQAQQLAGGEALAQARRRWADFAALHAGHLQREESRAYPAVRARLGGPEQAAMGHDMARRRGARYPDGGLSRGGGA
ncbi:hemerythrin domain-containing protein [Comamonas humi]